MFCAVILIYEIGKLILDIGDIKRVTDKYFPIGVEWYLDG